MYYHGSIINIETDYLEPSSAKVVNNEKAVFASNKLYWALFFIAKTKESEIECGTYGKIPMITEILPNMFNQKLKTVSGYIYYVEPKYFHTDKRLGMTNEEFISYNRVPIIKKEFIPNIYIALTKTKVNLITFDQRMLAIATYIKYKNNTHKRKHKKYQAKT